MKILPTKPELSPAALERLMRRHLEVISPDAWLFLAVVVQALRDCRAHSRDVRRDARRFFSDGRMHGFADHIGINPEFVREVARKTGYLSADAPELGAANHA